MSHETASSEPPDRSDLPMAPDLLLQDAPGVRPSFDPTNPMPTAAEDMPLAVYLLSRVTQNLPPEVGSLQNIRPELHDSISLEFAVAVKQVLSTIARENKPPEPTEGDAASAGIAPSKQVPYVIIPDNSFTIRFREHQREVELSPAKRRELQFKHTQALNLKRRIWHTFPEIALARTLNAHLQSINGQYPGAAAIMQDVLVVYDRCVTSMLIVSGQATLRKKLAERQQIKNVPHE